MLHQQLSTMSDGTFAQCLAFPWAVPSWTRQRKGKLATHHSPKVAHLYDEAEDFSKVQFSAIYVFHDPRNWALDGMCATFLVSDNHAQYVQCR